MRRKLSEETKRKIGLANKGRKYPKTIEAIENHRKTMIGKMPKFIPNNKGRKHTKEHIQKIIDSRKHLVGANHWNWKGGITKEVMKIRNSIEYKLWRKSVFERDSFTCVWCGQIGGKLNADHIKPFSLYPELRLAIDNGRTLCVPCHKKTDTYLSKANRKNI